MKKLAICIPNYERFEFFKRLINQLIEQVSVSRYIQDIEICVSDNNSKSNVENFMEQIIEKNRGVQIKFQKLPENIGPMENALRVIDMADSQYCWLIGNDDMLAKSDTVDTVMSCISRDKNSVDFICFGFHLVDDRINVCLDIDPHSGKYLNPVLEADINMIKNMQADAGAYFDCSKQDDILSEYAFIRLFLFYSSLVFKKSNWLKAHSENWSSAVRDSYWYYAYLHFKKLIDGGKVQYIHDVLVIRELAPDLIYPANYYSILAEEHLQLAKCLDNENLKVGLFKHLIAYRALDCVSLLGMSDFSICFVPAVFKLTRFTPAEYDNLIWSLFRFSSNLNMKVIKKTEELRNKIIRLLDVPQIYTENVLLFGSGKLGILVGDYLLRNGVKIKNYVDNDKSKQGRDINSVQVISVEESLELSNSVYIIAISQPKAADDVQRQLKAMNVPYENIIQL